MKIAISTSSFGLVDSSPLDLLKSEGHELSINPYGRKLTRKETIKLLDNVDGLIAGVETLDEYVFEKAPKLKAIARVGIGLENIDLISAKKACIKVSNTPDGPTDSVSELTITAALVLTRNIITANNLMHKKQWKKSVSNGLKNSIVFIVGFGRIGQKVAYLFKILGSKIFVYDPFIETSNIDKDINFLTKLEEGLKIADIISLHASGDSTILGDLEFNLMKKGVIILNPSRGNLLNEASLINAMNKKIVASAWIDVFKEEPYDGELTNYSQVLLTPHLSTYSAPCRKQMEMEAVLNILNDLSINK